MKVKVEINKVLIEEIDKMNAGEYKIHNVEFTLDEVYNDLIKKVTFSDGKRNFLVNLEGDTCDIPYEIFEEKGRKTIGFYAYESVGDELVLRYSPKSEPFNVSDGSYREDFDNYHEPTPDMIDQLEEEINSKLSKTEASETYATKSEVPDVSNYYTKSEVDSKIPDISNLATKEEASIVNQEVYSKTEAIPVGKWIDGRTIYRQVYENTTNTTANSDKDIVSMDNTCDEIIKIDGWIFESTTSKHALNFWAANAAWSRTNIKIENNIWKVKNKVANADWLLNKNTICYVDFVLKNS